MQLANNKTRLIIADDHTLFRDGLKNALSQNQNLEIVGLAKNGKEAITLTNNLRPNVVMLDIRMPLIDGRLACKQIKQHNKEVSIIAFTSFDSEELLVGMRIAGASGYLLKNTDVPEIEKAIKVVSEGGEYYCNAIKKRVDELYRVGSLGRGSEEIKESFTAIELEIIKLLCQEMSSKEIGNVLKLNQRTIEHHKERIQEKMGVRSSVGIAVYAINNFLGT